MERTDVVRATQRHVQATLHGDSSGHDWWHVQRVWQMAQRLAADEGDVDLLVVELAALLHDIADWKFHQGDVMAGPRAANAWLKSQNLNATTTDHICEIVQHLSFKGAGDTSRMATKEGQIVQDADRLDALGAIGIARAFAYGGYAGHELYNPQVPPTSHASFAAYKADQSHTVNHFHEKLLLLRDRMNTESARRIAHGRHRYMEAFLARFHREWDGER